MTSRVRRGEDPHGVGGVVYSYEYVNNMTRLINQPEGRYKTCRILIVYHNTFYNMPCDRAAKANACPRCWRACLRTESRQCTGFANSYFGIFWFEYESDDIYILVCTFNLCNTAAALTRRLKKTSGSKSRRAVPVATINAAGSVLGKV